MKKRFIVIVFVFSCMLLGVLGVHAQNGQTETSAAKQMLDAKRYEFVAQSMTPTSGRLRQITSYYSLVVTPDSINCDLPYVGRAFTAPMDPAAGGVTFISTSFDYTITDRKKGGWDIEIKPKDVTTVQKLQLTVYSNGNAYLRVSSNQRQPISYNGNVEAIKEKKSQ